MGSNHVACAGSLSFTSLQLTGRIHDARRQPVTHRMGFATAGRWHARGRCLTTLKSSPWERDLATFGSFMFGAFARAILGKNRKQGISSPGDGPCSSSDPPPIEMVIPSELAKLKAESDSCVRDPDGVNDVAILPHIITALSDEPILFCDSSQRSQKAETECSVLMLPPDVVQATPWQLKLSDVPSRCRGQSISVMMSDANQLSKFKTDVRQLIAASLQVNPERIGICNVRAGSVAVDFTVADLTKEEKEKFLCIAAALDTNFQRQLDTFLSLKIPLAAVALSFDVGCFDERSTRSEWEGWSFDVGPPGSTWRYMQPVGWSRYGRKVLGMHEDDLWLEPFRGDGNWYRGFHGMRDPKRSANAIFKHGFIPSGDPRHAKTLTAHGNGVYISPYADYAEGYCGSFALPGTKGQIKVKAAFQVAVRPGSQKEATDKEWVVSDPNDVRVYGLLLKEA